MAMSSTSRNKISDRFVILALGLTLFLGLPTLTSAQAPEQLRMLEQLSLAERQALLEAVEGANVVGVKAVVSMCGQFVCSFWVMPTSRARTL
jgi:hypothetical protein